MEDNVQETVQERIAVEQPHEVEAKLGDVVLVVHVMMQHGRRQERYCESKRDKTYDEDVSGGSNRFQCHQPGVRRATADRLHLSRKLAVHPQEDDEDSRSCKDQHEHRKHYRDGECENHRHRFASFMCLKRERAVVGAEPSGHWDS